MMHGDEKSVKDSDLADLAGQYCLSLIAKYVPKHSSCMLKGCKILDASPAGKHLGKVGNQSGERTGSCQGWHP